MTSLQELIKAVKEENLSKDMLEKYHTAVTHLTVDMELELANIEKLSAIYFENNKTDEANGKVYTDIAVKRMWQVTGEGQREIELKRWLRVTGRLLTSCKTRLYSIY